MSITCDSNSFKARVLVALVVQECGSQDLMVLRFDMLGDVNDPEGHTLHLLHDLVLGPVGAFNCAMNLVQMGLGVEGMTKSG